MCSCVRSETSNETKTKNKMERALLLNLPNETLIYIFEFLKFEEVAKCRIVCKRIDEICQNILNHGFQRAAHQHAAIYNRIKSQLPQRQSERRNHPLARHIEILTVIKTDISVFSMIHTIYIDSNVCCFILGRVLDEIFHILRLTMQSTIPLRPWEILQELDDISSLAIEHFDENVAIEFKKMIKQNPFINFLRRVIENPNCFHRRSNLTAENVVNLEQHSPKTAAKSGLPASTQTLRRPKEAQKQNTAIKKLQKRITTLQTQQKKHLNFVVRKVNTLTTQVSCMKRRLDELDSKNQEESQTENSNNNVNTIEMNVPGAATEQQKTTSETNSNEAIKTK